MLGCYSTVLYYTGCDLFHVLIRICTYFHVAGGDYTMTVTPISSYVIGSTSSITITAQPEVVSLHEANASTTSVTVNWTDPPGVSDNFNVDCSSGTSRKTDESNGGTVVCENIDIPGGDVTVTVVAVSNGKLSNASSTTVTSYPESVVLSENETLSPIDTITATWPPATGEADRYEVTCDDGIAAPGVIQFKENQTQYTASCNNLSIPGEAFNIIVEAISGNKTSLEDSISITTIPSMPVLMEIDSTETSISVEWNNPTGVVDQYNVECGDGTVEKEVIQFSEGELYNASCTNLTTPGGLYSINVTSQSGGKYSQVAGKGIYACK